MMIPEMRSLRTVLRELWSMRAALMISASLMVPELSRSKAAGLEGGKEGDPY